MERESFVFYRSFYEAISELSDEQKGVIFDAVCGYAFDKKLPEISGVEKAIFTLIKPQIDANNKKYENGLKGAEHGKKGGRPKGKKTPKKPQENPKETPNVNVNVNENENVNGENNPTNNLWFDGKLIRLNEHDYNSWLGIYGGTDNQFTEWLTSRDTWYSEQAPEIQKNWFIATSRQLEKIAA